MAALVEGGDELAKAWLLALIEEEPLARARSIPVDQLAREGPAICVLVVRALASDCELEAVASSDDRAARAGELAGANKAEDVSRAVDALRAVVWSALLRALSDPDATLVAELAERLALVCELVRGAALRRLAGDPAAQRWPDALDRALARAGRAGAELSVVLVELEDAARMLEVEPDTVVALVAVVRSAVAGTGAEVQTDGSRVWVIAPVGRDRAEDLAATVAGAVRDSGSPHGAPLRAHVGVAALGIDGADAGELIDAAEEASLAAAARGIEIARLREPD